MVHVLGVTDVLVVVMHAQVVQVVDQVVVAAVDVQTHVETVADV